MMKECSAVYSNVVCPSLLGCLRGGRPSEGLLGTKADDDNFDDCASIYFKLSWTSYCANKLQNMFANRTENRVILCWVFFQRWYKTSLTSWAPARLGQGGQGRHRLDWRGRQKSPTVKEFRIFPTTAQCPRCQIGCTEYSLIRYPKISAPLSVTSKHPGSTWRRS